MKSFRGIAIAIALASPAAVSAADDFYPMEQRVQPQTQGNVSYMCGGVGQNEAEYMKQAARDYDVMLTFASRSGAYLADVDVSIANARGETVLETRCEGPIMLVSLPRAGTYRVHAETAGHDVRQTIRSSGKGQRSYVFRWPEQAEDEGRMG